MPSPAVTRLKGEAKTHEQNFTELRCNSAMGLSAKALSALQECDRVADSPDREADSSPATQHSPVPRDMRNAAQSSRQPVFGSQLAAKSSMALSRIKTSTDAAKETSMLPPRTICPQARRGCSGSSPIQIDNPEAFTHHDALHVGLTLVKTRRHPPSQVS